MTDPTATLAEEWRPVVGWEGYYEVSNLGRIRSVDRTLITSAGVERRVYGQVLRPSTRKYGHQYVVLSESARKNVHMYVHRAVLTAFVGVGPEGTECCHRDGSSANNAVSNLYWGSRSENVQDMLRHGTHTRSNITECLWGHAYTKDNTGYRKVHGSPGKRQRVCLICERTRTRKYKQRRRESARGVMANG